MGKFTGKKYTRDGFPFHLREGCARGNGNSRSNVATSGIAAEAAAAEEAQA